jgi:CsoR family transcriptional regulator, copper-sensing transcriptional repressor
VHVEDVVGRDGRRLRPLQRAVAGAGDDEPKRRAQAGAAIDLEEDQLIAPGEEAEPFGGDALLADGASKPVGEREAVVQRIHPAGSVPGPPIGRPERFALSPILPGGMIEPMSSPESPAPPVAPPVAHGNGADHFRHSYTRDKAQLVRRLARIEGQVRGISRMIEREEYCVDILQQTSALRAAVDSLAMLVLEDHVQGCVRTAAEHGDADRYVEEVVDVVRRTLGRPVRSATRS